MIRLHHVGVWYRIANGAIEALRDIQLEIGTEFLGVVGPSGCGKSTLLRVLAGLVLPTEGEVEFKKDMDFSYGIVFQDYSLLPWLTVQQNIELGLKMRGGPPEERAKVSQRLLRQLGLDDAGHLLPHQLSGGMQQRVAVGRAFAQSPSLLLMDEPFGALDAITREDVQEILARLYESEPLTVVFVTHDVEEALFLSDRICVLTARPGRVQKVIEVPFLRPRRQEVKRDSIFVNMKYRIEDMLRGQKEYARTGGSL
ncbi:ABC transporter ATP-binding protein [Candidatus Poribacteria bacterium]|nr:ABC transporter ATP-binding protein [Candidatus Poribacteria bacterium]